MFQYFQKMIGRKYQDSTRRQQYSESIDTFHLFVDSLGFTYVLIFPKNDCPEISRFHAQQIL